MPKEHTIEWQVILNPHAGGGKGAHDKKKIEQLLKDSGLPFRLSISEYPRHAIEIACELVAGGATHLIVAGGDGTLNEVVNGIFLAGDNGQQEIILGMLPVGTGNDWIKTFGIPDHYQQAIDLIKANKTVKQDVGEITCLMEGQTSRRYFVNIAGFGFDALVAKNANQLKSKGVTGIRVYIQSLLSGYLNYKSSASQLTIDGAVLNANLFSASIGLGKFNGGGMMQVPYAIPDDGLLDVTLIKKTSKWNVVRYARKLFDGSLVDLPIVATFRGENIRIRSIGKVFLETDGESLGHTPFTFEVLPRCIRIVTGN